MLSIHQVKRNKDFCSLPNFKYCSDFERALLAFICMHFPCPLLFQEKLLRAFKKMDNSSILSVEKRVFFQFLLQVLRDCGEGMWKESVNVPLRIPSSQEIYLLFLIMSFLWLSVTWCRLGKWQLLFLKLLLLYNQ